MSVSASLLLHLVQFSRQLIVILDESVDMVVNVQDMLSPHRLHVQTRSGPEIATPEAWLTWLESCLGITKPATSMENRLRTAYERLTQHPDPVVLLITQTAAIPLPVMALICSAMEKNMGVQGRLRVVLFGSGAFHEQIMQSDLGSRYQTLAYVIVQDDLHPSTDPVDTMPSPESAAEHAVTRSALKWHWIGAAACTTVVVTIFANLQLEWLAQQEANPVPSASQILPVQPDIQVDWPREATPLSAMPEGASRMAALPVATQPTIPTPSEPQSAASTAPETNPASAPVVAAAQPAPATIPEISSAPPPVVIPVPAATAVAPVAAIPQSATPRATRIPAPRPATPRNYTYTLQVASLKNKVQAEKLRKQYPYLKMAVVGTGAHTRYQLYMGPFSRPELAHAAQKKLDPRLLALQPWLKKIPPAVFASR